MNKNKGKLSKKKSLRKLDQLQKQFAELTKTEKAVQYKVIDGQKYPTKINLGPIEYQRGVATT